MKYFGVANGQLGVLTKRKPMASAGGLVGEVLINRSAYQVKPFYLSSETVLPIE